jgi:hypothetical protein
MELHSDPVKNVKLFLRRPFGRIPRGSSKRASCLTVMGCPFRHSGQGCPSISPSLVQISELAIRLTCAFSKMPLMSESSSARFEASLFSPESFIALSRPYSNQRLPAISAIASSGRHES